MDDSLQPEMVRPQLFIASARTERNRAVLEHHGITHVLQVGFELSQSHPDRFQYLQLPVYDVPEQDIVAVFPAAFNFIETAINQGGSVLVHCHAGISRSATVVIAYCMWKSQLSTDAATAVVAAARNVIWPNIGFKRQLMEFEHLGCDASQWKGWNMSIFLSKQYGDESVGFMAAMLGGTPQDRVGLIDSQQQAYKAHGSASWSCDATRLSSTPCATAGKRGSKSETSQGTAGRLSGQQPQSVPLPACTYQPAIGGKDTSSPKCSTVKPDTLAVVGDASRHVPVCQMARCSQCVYGSCSNCATHDLHRRRSVQHVLAAMTNVTPRLDLLQHLPGRNGSHLAEETVLQMAG